MFFYFILFYCKNSRHITSHRLTSNGSKVSQSDKKCSGCIARRLLSSFDTFESRKSPNYCLWLGPSRRLRHPSSF